VQLGGQYTSCPCFWLYNSFFLQAEDGIRDRNVTGVQTCALPILQQHYISSAACAGWSAERCLNKGKKTAPKHWPIWNWCGSPCRSEERRVGKEWRCGWWTDRANETEAKRATGDRGSWTCTQHDTQ